MKKVNISLLLIFSIQMCQNSFAGKPMLKAAATEFNKGLNKLSDTIDDAKSELPNIGVNSADKIATSLDGIKDEMKNLGANSAKTASNSIDKAVKAGSFIAIGGGVYLVYREVKKLYCSYNPSTEEQLKEKTVSKELEIMKAKDELYKSLVAHSADEKNNRGIPYACEEFADKYASVAGFYALAEVTEEFKRSTTKTVWQKCTAW